MPSPPQALSAVTPLPAASQPRPLFVAYSPRSGSDLLADLLSRSGWGEPRQQLTGSSVGGARRSWGVMLDWHQLRALAAERTGDRSPNAAAMAVVAEQLAPGARWVHLTRCDRAVQAVAHVQATATGVTADHGDRGVSAADAGHDLPHLHRTADMMVALERAWKRVFAAAGRHPLEVTFEQLAATPHAALTSIATAVGRPPPRADLPSVPPVDPRLGGLAHHLTRARARFAVDPGPDGAPAFAIVGTGRCGTAFTAALLRAVGIDCGHENWWTVDPGERRDGLAGDSSWLAVPFLDRYAGTVIHQVRDPLDVVNSLVGMRFFSDPRHGGYQNLAFEQLPALTGDDVTDAVRWCVAWYRRCGRYAQRCVRVEDLEPMVLRDLTVELGWPVTARAARGAFERVSTGRNTRRRAALRWCDLPAGADTDRLRQMAADHGYPAG